MNANHEVLTPISRTLSDNYRSNESPTIDHHKSDAGTHENGKRRVLTTLWCVPIALVTAELSTTFPENGGFTVWVYHAFGPFWGFQEGYWAWLAGAIDNAIYPALSVGTISTYTGDFGFPEKEWLLCALL